MALAPKFAGQLFTAGETPKGIHTLELCTFTLHNVLVPLD